MRDSRFEQAAVALASLGYHVFPCRPHRKEPATANGWHDAVRDEGQILRWWGNTSDLNIGIACGPSGIAVVDIDSKHGADPREVIPELGLERYPLVWTGEAPERSAKHPNSLPGVRGAQIYFRGDLRTCKTTLPGVELRAGGSYVLTVPSVHPCGVPYEGRVPGGAELTPVPQSVVAILGAEVDPKRVPEDGEHVCEGGRHEALLAWALSRLAARGILGEEALLRMRARNTEMCDPPLPDAEVVRLWGFLDRSRIAKSERDRASSIHSAQTESQESHRAERNEGLPFMPLGEAIKNAPPEPNWSWDGYIAPGQLSLLAGRPKVGKSTLVFGLISAMLAGREFAARETRCKGVLLLSGEGLDTLAEKARRFGIAENLRFHVLLRRQVTASWAEVVIAAREYCREHDLDVLIVDTFDKWTGLRGDDENRSGPVLDACNSQLFAAGDGLAVVLITHQRKARGEHGEAVRGSNALVGAVDIIVELERVVDVPHARLLVGTSRHTSTPEELVIELGEDGYVDHGDTESLREKLDTEKVLGELTDEWTAAEEIAEAIEMPPATVRKRLADLYEQGQVERAGEGKKGSPYRWKILSARRDSLGAERRNGGPPEAEAATNRKVQTVADLTDEELLAIVPGAEIEHETDPPPKELDPDVWRICDPDGPMAAGKFCGGPLDGQRHPVPAHGPALVRYRVDGGIAFYTWKRGTRRTYEFAGEAKS